MRENCAFHEIGGLCHDVEGGFTLGPIVKQIVFLGARRQLSCRNRGPFHLDGDFVRALVDIQIADVQLVNTIPSDDPNFDKDVFVRRARCSTRDARTGLSRSSDFPERRQE